MNLEDFLAKRRQAEIVIKIYEELLAAIKAPENDDPLYGNPDADIPIQIVKAGIGCLISEQYGLLKPLSTYEIHIDEEETAETEEESDEEEDTEEED